MNATSALQVRKPSRRGFFAPVLNLQCDTLAEAQYTQLRLSDLGYDAKVEEDISVTVRGIDAEQYGDIFA